MNPLSGERITNGIQPGSLVKQFQNVVNNLEQSLMIIDCSLQILFANKSSKRHVASVLGLTLEENCNIWNYLAPDNRNEVYQQIQKAFAGEEVIINHSYTNSIPWQFPSKTIYEPLVEEDGTIASILIKDIEIYYLANNNHHKSTVLQSIAEEFTSKNSLIKLGYDSPPEDSNQQSSDLYRKLIAASTDGITIIDMNGKITFVSENAVRIAGCTSEAEIVGTNPQDWFDESERERILERMNLVLQGTEMCSNQYKMKRKSGDIFISEMNTTFLSTYDGSICGIISFIRDITDRKKMEDELIEAKEKAEESDRLKTAFLANISHEIRTPMNGIIGFSKLMVDQTITPETVLEYANIISTSCDQLLAIITDVIDISTIEAGQLSVKRDKLDVTVMFDELKKLFDRIASLNQIELEARYDSDFETLILYTDGHKVKQIFCNLLSNALKFSNNANVTFGYKVRNNQVEFFVKDDGIGISPEDHEIIFERFRQVDNGLKKIYGGTGLGLAISKSLVEMLGGKIWVESQTGLGSQFYFSIPAEDIQPSHLKPVSAVFQPYANCWLGKKILMAEDEEYNYLLICAMLKNTGVSIVRAKNGVEAFSLALASPVDMILMDIKMPLMGGLNATESIRQFNKQIPIVAISAYAFQQDRKRAMAAGCNDFITKPVNRDELLTLLNKYL